MFEDSFVQARVASAARQSRWSTLTSIAVQASLASLFILLPLLRTGGFDPGSPTPLAPPLQLLSPHTPPPRQIVKQPSTSAASTAFATPSAAVPKINFRPSAGEPEPTALATALLPMRNGSSVFQGLSNIVGVPSSVTPVVAAPTPRHAGPARVSSGVSTGLLLAPILPQYPRIAAAAHVQGSVIVEAVISKAGAIISAHVLSGPAMLQQAALDAIAAAHYRPFYLNGEPTEVQTTITINFTLGPGN